MIHNYFEAIEVEFSNITYFYLTLKPCVPQYWDRLYVCLIKQKIVKMKIENCSWLRQWQHIHELKSYIIDVWDISFGTFGANHLWKKNFGKGRGEKPWLAPWGWLIWEEYLFRGGFQPCQDTMAKISKVPVCLPKVAQTLEVYAAKMYIVIRHH